MTESKGRNLNLFPYRRDYEILYGNILLILKSEKFLKEWWYDNGELVNSIHKISTIKMQSTRHTWRFLHFSAFRYIQSVKKSVKYIYHRHWTQECLDYDLGMSCLFWHFLKGFYVRANFRVLNISVATC